MPSKTRLLFSRESLPTRSVKEDLSKVTTCETFATESFGRPVRRASRSTFPGASAHFRLLVSGTQRTVAILLRLNGSPCTTTTGRRNPGPEPAGSGSSAHQISPWEITTRHVPKFGRKPKWQTYFPAAHFVLLCGPVPQLHHPANAAPRIHVEPRNRAGFETSALFWQAALPFRIHLLVVISLSSYLKYKPGYS